MAIRTVPPPASRVTTRPPAKLTRAAGRAAGCTHGSTLAAGVLYAAGNDTRVAQLGENPPTSIPIHSSAMIGKITVKPAHRNPTTHRLAFHRQNMMPPMP